MVHMHAHPERMILSQHCTKLRRDALRQEDRHPRADPKKFDVWNRAKAGKNLIELVVAEKQGVPAAQQDVAHFGVGFQVTIDRFKFGMQFLFAHAADDAAPGAISAVAGASISHQK